MSQLNSSPKLSEQSSVTRGVAVVKLLEARRLMWQLKGRAIRSQDQEAAAMCDLLIEKISPVIVTVIREVAPVEEWQLSDEARSSIAAIIEADLNQRLVVTPEAAMPAGDHRRK